MNTDGTDNYAVAQIHSMHITEEHAPAMQHAHTFANRKSKSRRGHISTSYRVFPETS
jgi:hypothetical protein